MIVGGAGWVLGPVVGAVVTVLLPELLSALAEYRLLFFGALLLVVLWLAPEGVIGTLARCLRRRDPRPRRRRRLRRRRASSAGAAQPRSTVDGIGIAFGGIQRRDRRRASRAEPGRITSVIGPNGAGKTTVLNMIGGFYRPDAGSIRLGGASSPARRPGAIARAGIARTYQTTQLFGAMSVLDNMLVALRRGRLGNPLGDIAARRRPRVAEALLAFVGYRGALARAAGDLPHVDRRLVEIARALATRPRGAAARRARRRPDARRQGRAQRAAPRASPTSASP